MSGERGVPPILEIVCHVHSRCGISRQGRIALDVGAHVGKFSKDLLDSGLFAEVIAFEPNPENLGALAALAGREPNLVVVRSAVGAAEGEREFQSDRDTATGSLLDYRPGYVTDGAVRRMTVPVTTLDRYRAAERPKASIGLLKIDTQGHDLAVLQGAAAILEHDRPLVIVEMIHAPLYSGQADPDEIAALMKGKGYVLYSLCNVHATVEGRLAFADALFVPREMDGPLSQRFVQIDNHESHREQIRILEDICRERLSVINVLDAEVKRLPS